MRFSNLLFLAAASSTASAQRPTNTSICDYYTTAVLKNNTADNQYTLLTVLVNTVVIGNYTMPNVGVAVPGILAPGSVNNKAVNLLPYFSGGLKSTNTGGSSGSAVNFLDGGGAAPLKDNKPANDTTSRQYFLLTHLYQFFGSLLGCSKQGMPGFSSYQGVASMYQVHKFMDLSNEEVTYFIQQVGLAAQSFGVAQADITIVADALSSTFGQRCTAPAAVIKSQGPQLQAICIADDCPETKTNASCSSYAKAVEPATANGTSGTSPTGTASPSTMPSKAAGAVNSWSFAAGAAALAALAL